MIVIDTHTLAWRVSYAIKQPDSSRRQAKLVTADERLRRSPHVQAVW